MTEPGRALNASLTWDAWAALPAAVRVEVETPFSVRADLLHFPDCSPAEARDRTWQRNQLRIGGRLFDVRLEGRLADITTKQGMPLQGILLDDRAAVWDGCLYPLAPGELTTATALFAPGNPRGRCWLTGAGVRGEPVCALLAGKMYHFGSRDARDRVEKVLSAAADSLSPFAMVAALKAAEGAKGFDEDRVAAAVIAADSEWTETPKRVLCLRLDYSPAKGTPYTEDLMRRRMQAASDSLREMSYGKTWTEATVTPEVLFLPNSYQHYNTVSGYSSAIADDAKAAAEAAGYDLGAFDIFVYSFPRLWRTTTPAWAGGSNHWLNGRQLASVMVHEFGHNYGLGHANSWRGYTGTGFEGHRNPDFSLVEHTEYGDVFDLMGNDRWWSVVAEPVFPHGHFSMVGKAKLNWIEPDEIIDVTADGTYRVYRFDHLNARQAPGTPHALKVSTGEGRELWVGYRRAFTRNPSLSTGADLVWAVSGRSHRLLDTTPLSRPYLFPQFDMEDGALGVGKRYVDPSGTVRLTNLGGGGTAPMEFLDLRVEFTPDAGPEPRFRLYTTHGRGAEGLVGSYVNRSLRRIEAPFDWRSLPWLISGTRIDPYPGFTEKDWGDRELLGLTGGTDENWGFFSVQWDGYVQVLDAPLRFGMSGDAGSRLWIDLNRDGQFACTGCELVDHHWGKPGLVGLATHSSLSTVVTPGLYPIRIQHEEGFFANEFVLFAVPATQ